MQPARTARDRSIWPAVLYSLAVASCAVVLGLLGLIIVGITSGGGEGWIASGLDWWFSLPALVVFAVMSAFLYPLYRRQQSWARIAAFFLLNVVGITLASFLVTRILL